MLNKLQDMIGNATIPTINNNTHLVPANVNTISDAAKNIVTFIGDTDLSLKDTLNSVEKEMISRALQEVGGNVSMCARILKVQRTTLIERIKKYSLG